MTIIENKYIYVKQNGIKRGERERERERERRGERERRQGERESEREERERERERWTRRTRHRCACTHVHREGAWQRPRSALARSEPCRSGRTPPRAGPARAPPQSAGCCHLRWKRRDGGMNEG